MAYIREDIPISRSEKFRVFADGQELAVYCGVDFDYVHMLTTDLVEVRVETAEKVEKVDIRPTRRGKKYTRVDDHTVTLTLARGDYYCFELNEDLERPLLLFADEHKPLLPYNEYKVMAFTEPGYYKVGEIALESNMLLYLGEGVVVNGYVRGCDVKNVRILGNGMLYRVGETADRHIPINLDRCEDVEVNGITIQGQNCWNLRMNACRNVVVEDLKILADMIWSDGIDLVGGENILIRHIFVKNEDDCMCIKSSFARSGGFKGFDVRNVLVEDCVFWNGPRGNSIEIGYETNNSTVEHIMFRNVDVVHRETQESKFHRSIISIHNSGNAIIRDIVYENIYAESTDENFVQIAHMLQPSWGEGRGSMENITIRNLTLAGGELRPSKVSAHAPNDPDPRITRNITFENLTILGDPIRSKEDAIAHGFTLDDDVENLRFL